MRLSPNATRLSLAPQVAFPGSFSQRSRPDHLPLPALALSPAGLSQFNLQKGLLHSSLTNVAVFPPRPRARSKSFEDNPFLRHYFASPFLIDIRLAFSTPSATTEFLGLKTWWVGTTTRTTAYPPNRTKVLSAGDEEDHLSHNRDRPGNCELGPASSKTKLLVAAKLGTTSGSKLAGGVTAAALPSTDDIIRWLLRRLSPNVRSVIQLSKRWAKEWFLGSSTPPLSGVAMTFFVFRFLWQLLVSPAAGTPPGAEPARAAPPLDDGDQLHAPPNTLDEIAQLGESMGLGSRGARRGLVLHPNAPAREDFVLELFFGFLSFLVREAESFRECHQGKKSSREEVLFSRPEDAGQQQDGPHRVVDGRSASGGGRSVLKYPKSSCVVRWSMVPSEGGGDHLPFSFETERLTPFEEAYAPEAFFSDPRPTTTQLAIGDRVRRRGSLDQKSQEDGVITQIYFGEMQQSGKIFSVGWGESTTTSTGIYIKHF